MTSPQKMVNGSPPYGGEEDHDHGLPESTSNSTGYSISSRLCCNFPPSPYIICLASVLYYIPDSINNAAFDSVLYNKICFQQFDNRSMCTNTSFSYAHPKLQEDVAAWRTYHTLATLPLPVIITLMFSTYCDKVGHKLPYALPIIGSTLCTLFLAILATPRFIDWPMASVFVFSFLYSFLGSYSMVRMSAFSYVGLAVTREKRNFAMALCEGTQLIGTLFGNLIKEPIIDKIGLGNMLYVNVVLTLLPLAVVLILVTDITATSQTKYTRRDAFGISQLSELVKCIFRKRRAKRRLLIHLSFIAYMCALVTVTGFLGLSPSYFLTEKLMSPTVYIIFRDYSSGLVGFGGPAIVVLVKILFGKLNQLNLAVTSAGLMIIGYIIIAIDSIPYGIWVGVTLHGMQSIFFAVNRTLQISFVEKRELGKLFAYEAIIQTVIQTVTIVSFKWFYSVTLPVGTGLFVELCALLFLAALIIFMYLIKVNSAEDERKAGLVAGS